MKPSLKQHKHIPWVPVLIAGLSAFSCSDTSDEKRDSAINTGDGGSSSGNSNGATGGTMGATGGTAAAGGSATGGSASSSCMADAECGEAMICQFGSCRAAVCTEDADCGPGRVCDGGRCGVESCDPPLIAFIYTPAEGEEPDEVFLSGSMNAWSTTKSVSWQLSEQPDGNFEGEFPIASGQHSYKYQLYTGDEMEPQWIADQNVVAWEVDGFDGVNSRLAVSCDGLEEIEVECSTDTECEGEEICEGISCVAAQCSTDEQCIEGNDCDGGRCVAPTCDSVDTAFTLEVSDLPDGVGNGVGGAASAATLVQIAGGFTDWATGAVEMTPDGDSWSVEVTLPGGIHEYKFIVDGTWIVDPGHDRVQNENSFISVPCEPSGMGGAGGMGGYGGSR